MWSFSKSVDLSIDPTMQLTDDNYEAIIRHLIALDVIDLSHFCKPKVEKVRLSRSNHNRSTSLWTSSWGQMLLDPALRVHKSWENLKFRRRFRMPYEAFIKFVDECRISNIFDEQYQGKIPIEFKVLACLRILGRDMCADEIEEHLNIGESTVNAFFKKFVHGCATKLYAKHVYVPVGEEMDKVEATYARLGLAGCVGSMDCTHIRLDKCPIELSNLCLGKEKFTSLSFQVVVDHAKRIHHCSRYFFGTVNDKNITLNDTYPMELASGRVHAARRFKLFTRSGDATTWCGAYVIVDGGYHKYASFIDPMHDRFSLDEVMWSEWVESVRKDVECTFGVLKARFRILRNAVRFHSCQTVENIMRTCCMLHNIILEHDGECSRVDWEKLPPEEAADVDEIAVAEHAQIIETPSRAPVHFVPADGVPSLAAVPYRRANYTLLRAAMVKHFHHQYHRGAIEWPHRFSDAQQKRLPRVPDVLGRSQAVAFSHLYTNPSLLRRQDASGRFTRSIGLGLFSRLRYLPNDRICLFVGELVDAETMAARTAAGAGGYALAINDQLVLDCYASAAAGQCLASMANAPNRCINTATGRQAAANCKLVRVLTPTPAYYLRAITTIEPHLEIVCKYGDAYVFPP